MNNNQPYIWWKVECYHFETVSRSKTYIDSNGHTRYGSENVVVRIPTWSASDIYCYNYCTDNSDSFIVSDNPNAKIKLDLFKTFSFANQATKDDYNHKAMLFRLNNDRDTYQDFYYGIKIKGFEATRLGNLNSSHESCFDTHCWYWICCIFGFGPCYQMLFNARSYHKTLLINKQISI